jgi:hypothetical protein
MIFSGWLCSFLGLDVHNPGNDLGFYHVALVICSSRTNFQCRERGRAPNCAGPCLRPTGMEIADHVGMRLPSPIAAKVRMSGRERRIFVLDSERVLRRPEALREEEAGEGYRG